MAQRRHHYERAFEQYLRAARVPYISVDEARKALLPDNARLRYERVPAAASVRAEAPRATTPGAGGPADDAALKSFDFVIYGEGVNLLVEVKGRRISGKAQQTGRLEAWVTRDDVESLLAWERLFGEGFSSAFIFLYWCEAQPPDALFEEIFDDRGRWYAIRGCRVADYAARMKVRSPRWGTVDLSRQDFDAISGPLIRSPFAGR